METGDTGAICAGILAAGRRGRRRMVAVAGAPASGKSTLAEALAQALGAAGCAASVVPMDGFHLSNRILQARGLLPRKGAPESFDAEGFVALMPRLRDAPSVVYPLFDRARDLAEAGAGALDADCDTVIVEGNYLLFDAAPWRDLQPFWDISIRLTPPLPLLRQRLVDRWLAHGHSAEAAQARAEANDLPNARLIAQAALPADITLTGV
ncbi:nucleoside/nucleotide kinase family protein [Alphaproteobacteria bacterium KMM 3653]|uniref:Nucleoside/nucleotide kinase family protein n=1 Tax=Harenicola maris TaxID=2841044 RepID=A0AAP2G6T9_9RHOB|nr:nucleoside/nucleotide kinase family protein [Harenicola maris]